MKEKRLNMTIEELVRQRVLVLDGAMGTMIGQYKLADEYFRKDGFTVENSMKRRHYDMLNLTRKDVVSDIHRKYLEAGADIISTNTFSSQRISAAYYGNEQYCREMAFEGARIAKQCADNYSTAMKPRFVAGVIGPTNKSCSAISDKKKHASAKADYEEMYSAYLEQADALICGGVDALLIETVFDVINAKAAISSAVCVMKEKGVLLPIMVSFSVNEHTGKLFSGQTVDSLISLIADYPVFSVGVNCCSVNAAKTVLNDLSGKTSCYISVCPNAGNPDINGNYPETDSSVSIGMKDIIDAEHVNFVGGCCGTTDALTAEYSNMVTGKTPYNPFLSLNKNNKDI